jgi:chemotaxis protein MotA
MAGGKMDIILHALPHEMMAIAGAAIGAFIVSNSMATVKKAGGGIMRAFKGGKWKAQDYKDLLTLMFGVLSTFKKGGATGLEPHLDAPHESSLFAPYPRLLKDHHLIEFICDYLRDGCRYREASP